jgi:hypothetical protein
MQRASSEDTVNFRIDAYGPSKKYFGINNTNMGQTKKGRDMRSSFTTVAGVAELMANSSATMAQEFTTIKVHLDQTMAAKSVTDVALECAKEPLCKAIVDGAAAYGEEGHYDYRLPAGYQYCRSTVSPISVNPATGDKASVLGATVYQQGLGVYTWTPRKPVFGGRSWVDADFTIIGVQDALADQDRAKGLCKPNTPNRVIISCRGASGVNHGQPHCATVND